MVDITLTQFVIHNVRKDTEEPEKADELLDLEDEDIRGLAEEVVSLFWKKANISYGRFTNTNELFPSQLRGQVIVETPTLTLADDEFFALSKETTDKIHDEMKSTSGTGGYVAYLGYVKAHSTYYMAALIKNTSAFEIINLKPEKGFKVDTSKLHQAININIPNMLSYFNQHSEESSQVKNFIGLLSKTAEPTDYFRNAFASRSFVDNATASENAPKIVRKMLVQVGLPHDKAKQASYDVADYLIENNGKTVTLEKINDIANSYLAPEHSDKLDYLLEYVKTSDKEVPTSFRARSSSIVSLRKVSYSSKRWSVDIHKDLIGKEGDQNNSNFKYNSENCSLTINNLPDELKEQLDNIFNPPDESIED